jgi:UDP-N-acetylglucosamine:LPS N-acetylglucosamine transferase
VTPRRPRVLAISSRGGHWVQLKRLAPAFADCDVRWASTDPALAAQVAPAPFTPVPEASRWDRLRLAWMALCVAWLVVRLRPDVVVSTGAAPGFVALRAARLLGARTVWVDSVANAAELSLSGRKALGFADLTLTQWPHLGEPLPKATPPRRGTAHHAGSVL